MKQISDGAYWDLCQNCKHIYTRRSVAGSEFDTHYCQANWQPHKAWGYECDNFKHYKDKE